MKKSLLVGSLLLVAPVLVYVDSCDYRKNIEFTLDASSASKLIVDVGAGSLNIRGDGSSNEIVVVAEACASSRSRLQELDLLSDRRGDEITIRSDTSRKRSILFGLIGWRNFGETRIDVELVIPAGLALEVDDGSGSVDISGVSSLMLEDGSGSIDISNVQGDVYVDDGSGRIEIRGVRGLVSIEDGSGDLLVADSDSVHIVDDGSGSIRIQHISNNVYIEDDGSGGIDIDDVGGDVDVEDSGSGSLNVTNVAGTSKLDAGD